MQRSLTLLHVSLLIILLLGCRQNSPSPEPITDTDPVVNQAWFKQENTSLRESQVNCLLSRWYRGSVVKDTITLGVINDQAAYEAFFPCTLSTPLPLIDFNTYTLLIGFKSGSAAAGVSNISRIEQNLVQGPSGQYEYQVTVTGKTQGGGEWFGFSGLAPKLKNADAVKLTMAYRLN